jgi:hypothetical protein
MSDTPIGAKADHVRRAIKTDRRGDHHCHWPGCPEQVPAASWGCKTHWYKIPLALRNKVWHAYRPGQEESKTPNRKYVEVAREVQAWIRENHPNG